ncbi:hypothetical protein Ahy_B01g055936 [Arachis hypogaea]|uniref:phosphoribosylaminoimidazolesuccinocarboxamide synthase n=1 Tax=Arachis hypogaea TaxID=3818 RepID=A0A445AXJ7_ARAHY|nr:hypothetical protein Ahy_B01g055936 [Arachis hypogaea]
MKFEFPARVASEHGFILVNTKYEFWKAEDSLIMLIDEVHTPDSSRGLPILILSAFKMVWSLKMFDKV